MGHARAISAMVAAAVVLVSGMAAGEEGGLDVLRQPYVFAAPGRSDGISTLHVGAGADILVWKGLGVSVEGGYLGIMRYRLYGGGMLSGNVMYQLGQPQPGTITPFVTGGGTVGFGRSGRALNVGGGLNYWLSKDTGVRCELREHRSIEDGDTAGVNSWGLRVGFTWRR